MIPINGEPLITNNNNSVRQDWSKGKMINVIQNQVGK